MLGPNTQIDSSDVWYIYVQDPELDCYEYIYSQGTLILLSHIKRYASTQTSLLPSSFISFIFVLASASPQGGIFLLILPYLILQHVQLLEIPGL